MKPKFNFREWSGEISTCPWPVRDDPMDSQPEPESKREPINKDSLILACCLAFITLVCVILLVKSRAWFI